MTTPSEPKAIEPSDEELRAIPPDVGTVPFGDAALRARWRAGFHSRDGESADLAARSKEQIVTLSRLNEQLCEERRWTVAHLEHWKACAAARSNMLADKRAEVAALKVELTTATEQLEVSRAEADTLRAERDKLKDELEGARLLLERTRQQAASASVKADQDAWRKLLQEDQREGISPGPLALAAEEAVEAWLSHERETNPHWWPTWEEMTAIEKEHRGNPLTDVIRRIVGLQGAPLSQVLDTLRFKYHACGPWRSRALRKLSQAREALGCETEDDVPSAAAAFRTERDKLHAAIAWRETARRPIWDSGPALNYDAPGDAIVFEPHDGTDAGRAAALVRLFERCADGK